MASGQSESDSDNDLVEYPCPDFPFSLNTESPFKRISPVFSDTSQYVRHTVRTRRTKSSLIIRENKVKSDHSISQLSDNDELNKTLPMTVPQYSHFKKRHSPNKQSPPIRVPLPRSVTTRSGDRLMPNHRPDLSQYAPLSQDMEIQVKSDGSISQQATLLSSEDSMDSVDSFFSPDLYLTKLRSRRGSRELHRKHSLHMDSSSIFLPSPNDMAGGGPNMLSTVDGEPFTRRRSGKKWSPKGKAQSNFRTGTTESPLSPSDSDSPLEQIHELPMLPTMEDFSLRKKNFDSKIGTGDAAKIRPRARSLSPERRPKEILLDQDSSYNIIKAKIPKAKEEMEERLREFLTKYSDSKYEFSNSIVNFGWQKVLACARKILELSQDFSLEKDIFINISDDLEIVLAEVKTKEITGSEPVQLHKLVKEFLIVVGRMARLLEILDFDPNDFLSSTLAGADDGDDQAKSQIADIMASSYVPYIFSRLNMSISSKEELAIYQEHADLQCKLSYPTEFQV